MAANSKTAGGSVMPNRGSFVAASGFTFPEKDKDPRRIKLKKTSATGSKGKKGKDVPPRESPKSSPILPDMDEDTMSAFPTGQPREDQLEMVVCKHCKRPTLKPTAAEHIRGCLRAKQEKARRKKEARDANRAKERIEKGVVDGEDETGGVGGGDGADDNTAKGQKSAKKSAKGTGDDGTKKGKKRKMDGEDEKDGNNASKEPGKKKKKKDEPKAKAPRPKGPVDVEKQCGVTLPNGAQCARSLTCKSHSMGAKRAVPGRSLPYDMLLQAYQKKNQARQQKAAIDANAPLQDDMDNGGPVDSDEERDAVMASIARSHPQPLVTQPLISTKKKYHYVRIKEMLSHALGGTGDGGLFSTNESTSPTSTNPFELVEDTNTVPLSPPAAASAGTPDASPELARKTPAPQAARNANASVATGS